VFLFNFLAEIEIVFRTTVVQKIRGKGFLCVKKMRIKTSRGIVPFIKGLFVVMKKNKCQKLLEQKSIGKTFYLI
jgi:hypothetical protein